MGRTTSAVRRWRIAALVALTALISIGQPAAADDHLPVIDDPGDIGEVDPTVPFVTIDWTMPERYVDSPSLVVDEYDDGVFPPQPWNDAAYRDYLRPETWSVELSAAISNASNFGTPGSWSWQLTGPGYDETGTGPTPTFEVPALGTYEATVTVTPEGGGATLESTRDVVVDDVLVAVLGDSMASGEGNPDRPGRLSPGFVGTLHDLATPGQDPSEFFQSIADDIDDLYPETRKSEWVDPDCDRSARSGPALAAKDLEERDPRSSVTFVNVACTGAYSTNLVDLPHPGVLGDGIRRPPQLLDLAAALCLPDAPALEDPDSPYVRAGTPGPVEGFIDAPGDLASYDCDRATGARPIDAAVLSVGINDLGFRDLILRCADLDISFTSFTGWVAILENLVGWLDELIFDGVFTDLFEMLGIPFLSGGCDQEIGPGSVNERIDHGAELTAETLPRVAEEIELSGLVDGPILHLAYPDSGIASLQRIADTSVETPPFGVETCDGTALTRLDADELEHLWSVNRDLNEAISSTAATTGWVTTPGGLGDADSAAWWRERGYCSGAEGNGDVIDPDRTGFAGSVADGTEDTDRPVGAFRTLSESAAQYNSQIITEPGDGAGRLTPFLFGLLHPNAVGHEQLRRDIRGELVAHLRPITDRVTVRIDSLTISDTAAFDVDQLGPNADVASGRIEVARTSPDESGSQTIPEGGPLPLLPYRFAQDAPVNVPLNWTPTAPSRIDVTDQPVLGADDQPVTFDVDLSNVIEPDGSRESLRLAYQLSLPGGTAETICFETPFDPYDPLDPLGGDPASPTLRSFAAIGPIDGGGGGGPGPVECIPNVVSARSVQFDNQVPLGEPFGSYDLYPDQVVSPITWTASRGFGAGDSYRLVARHGAAADGSLEPGGFEAVLEFSIFPRDEAAPTADAGGPYVADEAAGTSLVLDGTGSTAADGGDLTHEWSGPLVDELADADVDWTQPTVEIPSGDDLGPLDVTLTVTDGDGRTHRDTTSVRVRNVAPTGEATLLVDGEPLADDAPGPLPEGATVTMEVSCADPGDDTHTVEIRWWDELAPVDGAGTTICPPGGATAGPYTFDYLDDSALADGGTFPVEVRITDDDGGTGAERWDLGVDNVDPSLAIGGGPVTVLPAGEAVLRRPGDTTDLEANVTDPGSEDLRLDWEDGSVDATNPSGPEPADAPSPGPTAPSTLTDDRTVAASGPGVITVPATATDDDGGTSGDTAVILTTSDLDRIQGSSFWWRTLTGRADPFSAADLQGVLDVVSWGSVEFEDLTPRTAAPVLRDGSSWRALLRMALLDSWLDVAAGEDGWDDRPLHRLPTVGEIITEAEALLAQPDPSAGDMEAAFVMLNQF